MKDSSVLKLRKAGFTEEQVEALDLLGIADSVSRQERHGVKISSEIRSEVTEKIDGLRMEFTKAQAKLKDDMSSFSTTTNRWIFVTNLTVIAIVVALVWVMDILG